jgi:uncharacterized protein Smg (DUF494 family)
MKERLVEILIYIMSEMQARNGLTDIDVSDLKARGYTQSEISAAVSWLHDHLNMATASRGAATRPVHGSHRVLHEAEKQMLTTDAQGYIIQLREVGLLDDADIENVIDRVMASGFEKTTPAELHEIVAQVLFSKPGTQAYLSRSALYNRDTIH